MAAIRRIAKYERVSSLDQRDRETIKTQTDALDARLASESGIEIVARFADDGVSGMRPLADRPGGRALLAAAEAGRFDELWLYRLDRLGRNLADTAQAGRRLEALGVTVVTLSEGRLTPFMFDLFATLAQNEHRVFHERSADGMDRAAREGRYAGGIVPLGYVVEGERATARLVPDERLLWADRSAAGLVRWMYERIALDHWTCPRLAGELNQLGIATPYARDGRGVRGKATAGVWRSGRLRNLLINPVYRGEQQYGRRTNKRGRQVISAPIPALVSPALWETARAVIAENRLMPRNTRRVYLLRSVVRCATCGLTYTGTRGRDGTPWYRCGGRTHERGPFEGQCPGRAVKGEPLEEVIWADIERFLRDPDAILDELDGIREREAASAVAEAESITLGRALGSLQDQRQRVIDLRIRDRITEAEAEDQLDRIAAAQAELERRVAALTLEPEPPEQLVPILEQVRARLDAGLRADERHEIVRLLVHVVIHTELGPDRKSRARAVVSYLFPAGVQTRTDRDSSRR
jgi:site-specific DNA recombinase